MRDTPEVGNKPKTTTERAARAARRASDLAASAAHFAALRTERQQKAMQELQAAGDVRALSPGDYKAAKAAADRALRRMR